MSGFPMRYRTGQCNLGNHPLCSWETCTCECHQPAEPAAPGLRGASRGEAADPRVGERPGPSQGELREQQAASRAACLASWPEAESMGYHPRCCRFPKSCSIEDPVDTGNVQVSEAQIEVHTADGGVLYLPKGVEFLEADDTVPVEKLAEWLHREFGGVNPWRDASEGAREGYRQVARNLRADLPELFR